MNPQLEGAIRSLIISLGSIAGTLGIMTGVDWVPIASAIVTIGGIAWSIWSNRPTGLVAQAAQSPQVVEVRMASQATADSIPDDKVTGPHQ
jgi:hypothetical protein